MRSKPSLANAWADGDCATEPTYSLDDAIDVIDYLL